MDQQELQQKIAEYFVKLKPKAQEAFSGMKWLDTLRTISQKYGLNEEQIQDLGTETTLVLLGIIHLDEYEKNLITNLKLNKEKEESMMEEINTFILNPIRPELSHAFNLNVGNIADENQENTEDIENSANKVIQKMDPRFLKLPIELQKIIKESDYQPKLYTVGKENGLTIAQIAKLEEIITNTILGEIKPEDFENALNMSLNLSSDKNKKIVGSINTEVLGEIRKELMRIYNKENANLSHEEDIILRNAGFQIDNSEQIKIVDKNKAKEDVSIKAGESLLKASGIEIEEEIKNEERDVVSEGEKEMLADISNTKLIKNAPTPIIIPQAKNTPSIIEQKMQGSFTIPSKKTEYSFTNNIKQNNTDTKILPKSDPYRAPIEE